MGGPHYNIPDRTHHFSEIYRSIADLKEMNGPVYNADYKHTYKPNDNINPDLKELVGPNYHVNSQHSYQHDFVKDTSTKETHGPVFKVERKHGYGADFSVRHRTASPCAGPVLNVERKHHYKAPLTQPHQRDLRAKSNTPTYEVNKSHHYQGSQSHKSDLTSMVGPIYNTGSVNLTKHNFSGGYQAQASAKQDKVELVGKFFQKEQKQQTVETKTTHMEQQMVSSVSQKVESSSGEERKQEALARRKEFLKEQEDMHMKLSVSEFKTTQVKSRQQLEEERELFIQRAVQMV